MQRDHRVLHAGSLEPSELNPTPEDVYKSYLEGRELAQRCGLFDKENEIQEMMAHEPEQFKEHEEQIRQADPLPERKTWLAMWSSGLRPLDVHDTAVREALQVGRAVEFIDPPVQMLVDFYKCATLLCAFVMSDIKCMQSLRGG
jgi:hypothetical protein